MWRELALSSLLATASCGWSTTEHTMLGAAVACVAADAITTSVGRNVYGLQEANPLAQKPWAFALLKVATLGIAYGIGEATDSRLSTWSSAAIANCGAASWNVSQIDHRH